MQTTEPKITEFEQEIIDAADTDGLSSEEIDAIRLMVHERVHAEPHLKHDMLLGVVAREGDEQFEPDEWSAAYKRRINAGGALRDALRAEWGKRGRSDYRYPCKRCDKTVEQDRWHVCRKCGHYDDNN